MNKIESEIQSVEERIADVFAPGGLLSRHLPGYEPREGQARLAAAIADVYDRVATLRTLQMLGGESEEVPEYSHLAAEAGVGIGKTLAYLVAAILSGKPVIVSTATKALQGQLLEKDIPLLAEMFPGQIRAAKVLGRNAYACLLELDRALKNDAQLTFDTVIAADLWGKLVAWIEQQATDGLSGEMDNAPFFVLDELRNRVTIDAEGCLGTKCSFAPQCFSQKVRVAAQQANIVVVNHAILLHDLAIKKETAGYVSIIPSHPHVVVDEAHQLANYATHVYAIDLTPGRWLRFGPRLRSLKVDLGKLAAADGKMSVEVQNAMVQIGAAERIVDDVGAKVTAWFAGLTPSLVGAKAKLLGKIPSEVMTDTRKLEDAIRAAASLARLPLLVGQHDDEAARWVKLHKQCIRLYRHLSIASRADRKDDGLVRYVETNDDRKYPSVKVAKIDVSEDLQTLLWDTHSVTAVSATLATSQRFDYWMGQVGCPVERTDTLIEPSPFNYREQALLYLPNNGAAFTPPRPKTAEMEAYEARMVDEMRQLLDASQGRAFLLFSSTRMMQLVAKELRGTLPWPMLMQGESSVPALIRRFKETPSVLLGLRSFWEGVDVQGEALSLVVIDKLPFPTPDDPLWAARCEAVGKEWFKELALPEVTLMLKQGMGRLLRRQDDRGAIAILDGRLRNRQYGSHILRSLPPMRIVGHIETVRAFFMEGQSMALPATGEQVRYMMDLAKQAAEDGDEAVSDALDEAGADTLHDLTREEASALIDTLRALLR